MKTYKVISPTGITIGGNRLKQGDTFQALSKSAHVGTALHFQQIVEQTEDDSPKASSKASSKDADKVPL